MYVNHDDVPLEETLLEIGNDLSLQLHELATYETAGQVVLLTGHFLKQTLEHEYLEGGVVEVLLIKGQRLQQILLLAVHYAAKVSHYLFGLVESGYLILLVLEYQRHGMNTHCQSLFMYFDIAFNFLSFDLQQLLLLLPFFVIQLVNSGSAHQFLSKSVHTCIEVADAFLHGFLSQL